MINGGYQLWAHKTLESPIFLDKPPEWFKLWFFLVMRVYFTENNKLPRGSIHLKYKWIESQVNVSRSTIDHFLRWAKSESMLATQKATRGMIITLLNYAKYQSPENYESDTKSESKANQKRIKSDTILKEREINKELKEKSPSEMANAVQKPVKEKKGKDEYVESVLASFQEIMGIDNWSDSVATRRRYAKLLQTSRRWSVEQVNALLKVAKVHPYHMKWCKMSDVYYKGVELIREYKQKIDNPSIAVIS